MRRRELPLTVKEKRAIRRLDAQGWDPGKIATELILLKRQVRWELAHGNRDESRTDRGNKHETDTKRR